MAVETLGPKKKPAPEPWEIEGVERARAVDRRWCWVARVLVQGGTLTFSRLDGSRLWCCDSSVGRDGRVQFSHGVGDRTRTKKQASGGLERALDARVLELEQAARPPAKILKFPGVA